MKDKIIEYISLHGEASIKNADFINTSTNKNNFINVDRILSRRLSVLFKAGLVDRVKVVPSASCSDGAKWYYSYCKKS